MNLKISFIIAAHNEEKIIEKTLENLSKIPYKNYEVILGLDGCTDNTEKIVKKFCNKSKKFRFYKLNLRKGKPAVIDSIIKHAEGDIIVINDADWIFKAKNSENFDKFFSVFNNPKIGGIAESFPVEYEESKMKNSSLGYKMTAYSSYYWLMYQKMNFTSKEKSYLVLNTPVMFLTNIFRRKLYEKNTSLGDDFERTKDIMAKNYKIILFDDISMPRMTAVYDKVKIRDLFKQKVRTAIARSQIKEEQKINSKNYYFPAVFFMLKKSFRDNIGIGFIVFFWAALTTTATIFSLFKKLSTKEGWALRARR